MHMALKYAYVYAYDMCIVHCASCSSLQGGIQHWFEPQLLWARQSRASQKMSASPYSSPEPAENASVSVPSSLGAVNKFRR